MIKNASCLKRIALIASVALGFSTSSLAQTGAAKGLLDEAAAAITAGRYVDALAAYAAAIAAAPGDAAVHAKRAQFFDQLGQPDLAARDYRVAVKLTPDDAGLQTNLCFDLALTNHDLDGALAACNAAVRLAPQSSSALSARGYLQLRRGAYAEASKDYSASLALLPASASEMFGLGVSWVHTGKAKEGRGEIASATLDSLDVVSDWENRGFDLQGEIKPGKPVTKVSQAAVSVKDRKVFLNKDERYAPVGDCGVVTTAGAAPPVAQWSGECRFGLIHGPGKLASGADARFTYGRELMGNTAALEQKLKLAYQSAEDAIKP
ncbi:MAG TPA: tetratricopeptide repeat protein [Hyphomonadaceae bacterium]|nr:tetratricopeptide repeat protein [Hyphomonadaceae bacterium]HPN04826.1 tetratricopeptide repeat protein [Hyphomonadaceae bacterium]